MKKKIILVILAYSRLCVAGAIGGVAIYNTISMVLSSSPTQSLESVAMASGAILAAGIAKILHVV